MSVNLLMESLDVEMSSADVNYGEMQYWDSRYSQDSDEAFHEWYFTYDELDPLLAPCFSSFTHGNTANTAIYGVVE